MSGSIDFEDLVTGQQVMSPWDRQARDLEQLADAGFEPTEMVPTVILEVETFDSQGNVTEHTVDCYAIGEDADINLAHGDLGAGEQWHLVTPCAEAGCTNNAYVVIFGTFDGGAKEPSFIASALKNAEARSHTTRCPDHHWVNSGGRSGR